MPLSPRSPTRDRVMPREQGHPMQLVRTREKKILTVFGTRPEVIKLAPVIEQLEVQRDAFRTVTLPSPQDTDLLYPFVRMFGIRVDHDLRIMEPNQTPNQVCARVLARLDLILDEERPDLILVQGDTTTAMAGALAGFHRRIPIGHVEAGLRSGNAYSPYPEEMNRRLITRLATYHFAATRRNRATLLSEGVPENTVFVTGNPVVDSLHAILDRTEVSPVVARLLEATGCSSPTREACRKRRRRWASRSSCSGRTRSDRKRSRQASRASSVASRRVWLSCSRRRTRTEAGFATSAAARILSARETAGSRS